MGSLPALNSFSSSTLYLFFLYAAYRLIHAYTRTNFPVVHVAHLAIMKTYTVYLHITS